LAPAILAGYKKTNIDVFSEDNINLMDALQKRLKQHNNIIVLPGTYSEKIKFIYTGTYGFYSNDNIKHYMQHYIIKKQNKLTDADKKILITNVQKMFSADTNTIELLF
jgi:hypothetical protein